MVEPAPRKRCLFRHRHRLHGRRQFSAVFNARCRKNHGPLAVFTRPNALAHNRLGLAVPRRVGNAVTRHRIKRLLREAFRLSQPTLPQGYDMLVSVYPHPPATLDAYRQWLADAAHAAERQWQRRRGRPDRDKSNPPHRRQTP